MDDAAGPHERSRRLIIGLGNPGPEYRDTRHNLGSWVVAALAERRRTALTKQECSALFVHTEDVDLAMPQTFMNRSGFAARCLVEHHGYGAESILVVYDDVNLELGRLRMRRGGSPGGHRGMESIIENLRTDTVPRLRLGIAPSLAEGEQPPDLIDFVLAPFTKDELETVYEETSRAVEACEAWLELGVEEAMNKYNS